MDVPDSATATLLCAPSVSSADRHVCAELLVDGVADGVNVLHIDFVRTPRDRIRHWQQAEASPSELAILNVDTYARSSSAPAAPTDGSELSAVVETVQNPDNLTQFGVAFTKCLDRWEDDDRPVRVCFHSISAFLHYADLAQVFQFLNVVRGQLSKIGARGHFHIEPDAHEERTLNKLKPLFDAVVEVNVDGELDVSVR
jgi:hypothetical protein